MKLNSFLPKRFIYRITLVSLAFLFAIASDRLVTAQSLTKIMQPTTVAQAYKKIDFRNNYYQQLIEADRFYKQGDLVKVKQIQQQVKPDFSPIDKAEAPSSDVAKLSPTSQEYWSSANAVLAQNPDSKKTIKKEVLEPLKKLVKESPDFVPGYILLADTYFYPLSKEKDGLKVIEKAAELYPGRDDVLDKKIELLLSENKPLEASIAAREFAYSYPDFYKSPEYLAAAEEYNEKYRDKIESRVAVGTIVGAGGQVATGNTGAALEIGQYLLEGESATGQALAEYYKSESPIITNPTQVQYISNIGHKMAKLMGRSEFTYEFNIIEDPSPNAFALPGGKIFFHTGMLQMMDSEAELAGVMAHEVAHSVLSHSYQKIAESSLTNATTGILSSVIGSDIVSQGLQIGNILLDKKFSRDKEKQADVLGLRVLDATGYSADGLYNVMAKLNQLSGQSNFAESLLSSHPASEERMRYLEELIQTKGYNRYGYEGVQEYQNIFPG